MFHFFYSKCLFIYFKRRYTECHEIKTILIWNENTLHEAYINCKLKYIFKFCIMLYQLTGKFIHVIIELSLSFLSTSITIISITHLGKVLILSFRGYLQTFFFKTQHISLWNIRVSPRNKKRKKNEKKKKTKSFNKKKFSRVAKSFIFFVHPDQIAQNTFYAPFCFTSHMQDVTQFHSHAFY